MWQTGDKRITLVLEKEPGVVLNQVFEQLTDFYYPFHFSIESSSTVMKKK